MITETERHQSVRDQQKAMTRAKVVAAARGLFGEIGYEAATIREIAKRAGVAPGSVFTTFESKAELLQEIIFSRYEALFTAVRDAVAGDDAPIERLTRFGYAAYKFEVGELRLLSENIGASWTWSAEADQANRDRLLPLFEIMVGLLKEAKDKGQIRRDTNLVMVADTIFSAYLRNFRKAKFDGATAHDMGDYLADQIRMICRGCA